MARSRCEPGPNHALIMASEVATELVALTLCWFVLSLDSWPATPPRAALATLVRRTPARPRAPERRTSKKSPTAAEKASPAPTPTAALRARRLASSYGTGGSDCEAPAAQMMHKEETPSNATPQRRDADAACRRRLQKDTEAKLGGSYARRRLGSPAAPEPPLAAWPRGAGSLSPLSLLIFSSLSPLSLISSPAAPVPPLAAWPRGSASRAR